MYSEKVELIGSTLWILKSISNSKFAFFKEKFRIFPAFSPLHFSPVSFTPLITFVWATKMSGKYENRLLISIQDFSLSYTIEYLLSFAK